MDEKNYLCEQINTCRRRMNLAKLLDKSLVGLALGAIPAIVLEAYSLILPFYDVHRAAAACVCLGLFAGIAVAVKNRCTMKEAARRIDSFGLFERTQTAYEHMDEAGEFALLQRKDAAVHLKEKERSIRIKICPARRHLAAAGCAFLCLLILACVPSSVREKASMLHDIKQEAKEQKEELEELIEALSNIDTDTLSDEQREKISEMLESLSLSSEELSQVTSQEELDAAAQKLDYKYEQTAEGLSALASLLEDPEKIGISDALASAKEAAENNGQQVASAGGDDGDNAGSEAGDGEGSSEGKGGDGSGEGSGTGEGEGSGAGSAGGQGEGNGSGEGSGEGGDSDGSGGTGRGTGSSDNTHDYVSIPNDIGDDESLSGQNSGTDSSDSYRGKNGLAWEGSHVSLDSVITEYTDAAYEGIASGRYPSGMEDVIKDYFKNLND